MARFENVSCSQCGKDLGPGEHGYSHCSDHGRPLFDPTDRTQGYVSDAEWRARLESVRTSEQRLSAVLDVVQRWLVPDGIDSGSAMVEICGLVDPLPAGVAPSPHPTFHGKPPTT